MGSLIAAGEVVESYDSYDSYDSHLGLYSRRREKPDFPFPSAVPLFDFETASNGVITFRTR